MEQPTVRKSDSKGGLSSPLDLRLLPQIDPEKLRARLYAKPDVHVNPRAGLQFPKQTAAQIRKVGHTPLPVPI